MRKGTHVIAAVLACCIVETAALFVIAIPAESGRLARPRQGTALVIGFLLIPFLASLFLRFIYGSHRWVIRTIGAVGLITVALIGFLAILFGETEPLNALPDEQRHSLSHLFFFLDLVLVIWLLWKFWRWTRRRSLELEIDRWLSERKSGIGRAETAAYNRAIRVAVCLPVVTVLLVILFFPSPWALASHAVHPTANRLAGYQINLPLSWVVLDSGKDYVYGVTATNMIQDPLRWARYGSIPVTGWSFSVHPNWPSELPRTSSNKIETRSFVTLKGAITCLSYWPAWLTKPDPRHVAVDCSGPGGFTANMYGQSQDVSAFYAVIAEISPTN